MNEKESLEMERKKVKVLEKQLKYLENEIKGLEEIHNIDSGILWEDNTPYNPNLNDLEGVED